MRICLVSSPRYNCKPTHKSLPPLGLATLGAVALQAGHEVVGVEGVFVGHPRKIAAEVAASNPEVVGTNTVTQDRLASIATIREIRKACPDALIVVGGAHYSCSAQDALESVPEIDVVVCGEGEQTFLELLEAGGDPKALSGIAGLAYRDGSGQFCMTEKRDPIMDITTLPRPAWELFSPQAYSAKASQLAKGRNGAMVVAGVMTSRGCPQRCVFCANANPTRVRYIEPTAAVDQIEWLRETLGVSNLDILDDDFLTSDNHAAAVCEEMLRRNVKVDWWCGARAKNLNPDVLKLMRRAGCRSIAFGVETGTDEVLRAIRKGTTTDDYRKAMHVAADSGIEQVGLCLIIGLPGETLDTIDRSLQFLDELRDILGPAWIRESAIGQLPLVYPGTGLESMSYEEGYLPKDFSWNSPYLEPQRALPLINHRYKTVPHYQSPSLPLESICRHLGKHHWDRLTHGRRRRYRRQPLRKLLTKIGLA
ncbi:MAG: radical SAM protein [Phycisphaerae bacterium]|jgi:radical SAM superfamily enzyme YgiQ (UPF0313 family)|nr:radical SAM protein [Phycisphaerae bacterium]